MTHTNDARAMYELKQKAVEFYNTNGVPKKMEEVLNTMFYDNPSDVFGHLANYFETFARKPTITKVQARDAIDSRGQPTLQTEIYCMVKNHEQLVSTILLPGETYLSEAAKPEDKDDEDKTRHTSLSAALQVIADSISDVLTGVDPCQQEEADVAVSDVLKKAQEEEEERLTKENEDNPEEIKEPEPVPPSPNPKKGGKSPKGKGKGSAAVHVIPDEPKETFFPGSHAVCAISTALCQAAAAVKHVPLYEHVARLRFGEVPEKFHMPLPMVTLLASGRAAPGKLNCVKEFMVVPKPGMSVQDSVRHISNMYNTIAKNLCQKAGATKAVPATARQVNDIGALVPMFDRPEQGLDMIQETLTQLELTEEFHIALNCAGHEMFDYDKGKYEVMGGQLKSADDLVEYWAELLDRYPTVIAVIDPMRKQEKGHWMRLCERISERCYVIGDHAYHRPGRLMHEEITEDFKTSGIVLQLEHVTTVSELLATSKKMEDVENQIVISSNVGDSPDTFLADLAVGTNAKFLKVGAPCRGERIAKLNRLLQMEACLTLQDKLETHGEHVFPKIIPPPVPEDEEEQNADGTATPEPTKKNK